MSASITIVGTIGNTPYVSDKHGYHQVWVSVKTVRFKRGEEVPKWHNVSSSGSTAGILELATPGDLVEIRGSLDYYKKKAYDSYGVPFQYPVAFIMAEFAYNYGKQRGGRVD